MDYKDIEKLRETAVGAELIDWIKEKARNTNSVSDIDPTLPDAEYAREARARAIASLKLAEILHPLIEELDQIVNPEELSEEARMYYGLPPQENNETQDKKK